MQMITGNYLLRYKFLKIRLRG